MAWKRIDDKQLAWDLMQAGLLYYGTRTGCRHYTEHHQLAWAPHKDLWLAASNKIEDYIQIEE